MKKYMIGMLAVSVASCFGEDVEKSDCEKAKAAYEGISIAAGISAQGTKTEVKLSDNLGTVGGADFVDMHDYKLYDKRTGRVGGSVALGYNQFAGPVFTGLEATVDICGDKTREVKDEGTDNDGYEWTKVKTHGVVPTIAAKVGGYIPSIDTLAYLRLGVAFPRTEVSNTFYPNAVKNKKAAFVLGAAVQKRVFDSLSLRLEGDYRFRTKKSASQRFVTLDGTVVDGTSANIENKSSGYVVRVMAVYIIYKEK